MMKKLLILMLVLGMTSVASATYSLNPPDLSDGVTTFGVIDIDQDIDLTDGFGEYVFVLCAVGANGALSNSMDNTGGGFSAILPYNDGTYGAGYSMAGGIFPGTIAAGTWFNLDYNGTNDLGEVITMYASDALGNITSTVIDTITVVPEPMTIALLGLGGLFLLRRRK